MNNRKQRKEHRKTLRMPMLVKQIPATANDHKHRMFINLIKLWGLQWL